MSASQAALQTAFGQNVGFGDHAGEAHRVFQRQGVKSGSEADAIRSLGGGREHRQRVRRNGKLLKEMVIYY